MDKQLDREGFVIYTHLCLTVCKMSDEEIGGEPVLPPHGQKNMERPLAPPARPRSDVKECLWPIGDPSDPEFSFCGAETSPGRPYCAAHCAMAYIRKDRTAA